MQKSLETVINDNTINIKYFMYNFSYQKLVGPPLFLITSNNRFFIDPTFVTSAGILSHSSTKAFFSFSLFLTPLVLIRWLISSHKCSMGLRSWYCGGVLSCLGALCKSYSFVIMAVCFGSLSCWKVNERSRPNFFGKLIQIIFK